MNELCDKCEIKKDLKELVDLLNKWADAEQEESYSIMDEIIGKAQDLQKEATV